MSLSNNWVYVNKKDAFEVITVIFFHIFTYMITIWKGWVVKKIQAVQLLYYLVYPGIYKGNGGIQALEEMWPPEAAWKTCSCLYSVLGIDA